jgi:hypothetical protein
MLVNPAIQAANWDRVASSVVRLSMGVKDSSEQRKFWCSGTIITKRAVLTAQHCAPEEGQILYADNLSAEIVLVDLPNDLMVLDVGTEPTPIERWRPIKVRGEDEPLRFGERVAVLGYGFGVPTLMQGPLPIPQSLPMRVTAWRLICESSSGIRDRPSSMTADASSPSRSASRVLRLVGSRCQRIPQSSAPLLRKNTNASVRSNTRGLHARIKSEEEGREDQLRLS